MNELSPYVSIILTSYNHENFIGDAIDSVLNQTFHNFELIIWDDCSSDSSWEIISEYKDPRFIAIRNEKQLRGIYNINKAINEVSKGKYIAIHHSDDVWEPEKLQKQVDFLDGNPSFGGVFTRARIINEQGNDLANKDHLYQKVFDQPNRTRFEWLRFFVENGNALCHPSVMVRKSVYQDIGAYSYGLAQLGDFDCWVRMCQKYEIHVLQEKLIRFRVLDNEKNSSGMRVDTYKRNYFESLLIFESFCNLSIDILLKIFPEIRPVEEEANLFDIYLSIVQLSSVSVLLKINLLQSVIKSFNQYPGRQNLNEYKKIIHELVRLTGEVDFSGFDNINTKMGLFSTIFVDSGTGFTQESSILKNVRIDLPVFEVVYDLSNYAIIKHLRFDPFEYHWGEVKLTEVSVVGVDGVEKKIDLALIQSNGSQSENGYVLFEISDPMFFIPTEATMTQIKIIGQWKVFEPRNIDTIFSQKKQQIAELKDTNDLLIRQMGLESTLFIDQGNGISGDTYQKHRINLKENTFQLEYSLETYGFIKEVRLDPFEDHWGTVKLDRVELLTLENQNVLYDLTNVRSNGRVLSSGEIRFETIDPMIYLPIDGSFKRIIFSGTKELLPYSEIENEVTEYRELLDGGDFTAVLFLENEHFNCYTKRVVYLDKEKFKIQFKFEHVQYIKSLKIEVSKRKIKKIRLRKIVYSSDFKKNRVFNLNLVQIDALKNGSGEILLKEDGSFVLFPGIGKVSSIEIVGYISKK